MSSRLEYMDTPLYKYTKEKQLEELEARRKAEQPKTARELMILIDSIFDPRQYRKRAKPFSIKIK